MNSPKIAFLSKLAFVFGGLSYAILALGHLGLLSWQYILPTVVSAILLMVYFSFKSFGSIEPRVKWTLPEKALVFLISLTIISILGLAALPPSARDELIQHLAVPKLYVMRQGIFEIKFMTFAYLPQNMDLLYAASLSLGSEIAPKVLHLVFAILTGVSLYLYITPVAGRRFGLLAMLLFLSTPLVFNLSRLAYTDLGAAFFSTLAVMAALRWREDFSVKWLVYSAALSGLAMGIKYNTLISLFLLCVFVLFARLKAEKRALPALRTSLVYFIVAFLVLCPWLIRNMLWGKSPMFPVFENALKAAASGAGIHVTGEMAPVAKRFVLYGEGLMDIALLPFRIFFEGSDNSIERFDGVLNPFFLFFIPLAFMKKGYFKDKVYIGLYFILFLAFTFLTIDIVTRYLMPTLPFVAALVAVGVKNGFERKWLRRVSVVVLIGLFAFNVFYAVKVYGRLKPFSYLTGGEGRVEYLKRVLPDYDAVSYANNTLPKDARVMLLFAGERGYYWEREYFYGDRVGNYFKWLVRESYRGDVPLADKFKRLGITHVFANEKILDEFAANNFNEDEIAVLRRFFIEHTAVLYSGKGYSLRALK